MSRRDYVTTAALVWSAVHGGSPQPVSVRQSIYIRAVSQDDAKRIADRVADVLRTYHVHDAGNHWYMLPDESVTVWYEADESGLVAVSGR